MVTWLFLSVTLNTKIKYLHESHNSLFPVGEPKELSEEAYNKQDTFQSLTENPTLNFTACLVIED